jgi:hypothetical protein
MNRVVTLEEIEADREKREGLDWSTARLMTSMMRPSHMRVKIGKRPVSKSGSFNQSLISRSPGSSQHPGLDFVKAVYSERTGQESEHYA